MHFVKNEKKKRKQEWESHKIALDVMKKVKEKILNNPIVKKGKLYIPR